jgi:acetyltransferase-like isoleucine patch superfamily enzyme
MTTPLLPRSRQLLIDLAVSCLGPVCLLCVKVAQQHSNRQQLAGCNHVGAGVTAGRDLEIYNDGLIKIGDQVSMASRVLLSSYRGGSIRIGEHSFLGDNVKIVSERANVSLGDGCLIAENVSIRASNHGTRSGTPMRLQPNDAADISIGNDVWIGHGVMVLAGSSIADGCVVGANSVVRGVTEPNTIYAGVPIRKIRSRSDE